MPQRSAALTALAAAAVAARRAGAYQTLYFNQSLTHDGTDPRTFSERYLLDATHAGNGTAPLDLGSCKTGPILFYTGNEGPIDAFWSGNGFMTDYLAPKWGAVVLMAEARYYGETLPFGNETFEPANLQWLTTELILADYALLLKTLKTTVLKDHADCPVLAFGGSYGGTLTTLFRLSYPDVVVGALAASAPIGYYDPEHWTAHGVDAYTWTNVVKRAFGGAAPGCLDAINATRAALRAAPAATVVDAFGLCDETALQPTQAALFEYALEALPQQDYAHPVGDLPAWPVDAVCAALAQAATDEELIAAAAKWSKLALGAPASGCWPTLDEGPGGVPGDGPGPGAWGYQSCTETLHQFSSDSAVRDYEFDLTAQSDLCFKLYGVRPDPTKLARLFGGYAIPGNVTNVVFSNGLRDPWSGGGFYAAAPSEAHASNAFCVMPSGAHHSDLRTPMDDDPDDVKKCRELEEARLAGYLVAAQ